jgi:hypothetical protein
MVELLQDPYPQQRSVSATGPIHNELWGFVVSMLSFSTLHSQSHVYALGFRALMITLSLVVDDKREMDFSYPTGLSYEIWC